MKHWVLGAIGFGVIAAGVGVGEIVLATRSSELALSDKQVEEPENLRLEPRDGAAVADPVESFVPQPIDPQVRWIEANQSALESNIEFNEITFSRVRGSIELGMADLRYGDLSSAASSFSFAQGDLMSLSRLSPMASYGRPPKRECESSLIEYDALVFSPDLEWNLSSIQRTISEIDLQLSQDEEIEDRYFGYLETEARLVVGSFDRLIQSHGSAAQNISRICEFERS